MAKRYHSGADRRAVNRPFLVMSVTVMLGVFLYVGYTFYKLGRGEFEDDRAVFLTCSGTIFLFIGVTFAAFMSSRRDQWRAVKENRRNNYCVLKDNGLKIHTKFFSASKERDLFIPYDNIRHVDRLNRNIIKEMRQMRTSARMMRHIPVTGKGILYPNFTHPDDVLRLKLREEMDITSVHSMQNTTTSKSDIIYISIDAGLQHDFMTELRKRIRS